MLHLFGIFNRASLSLQCFLLFACALVPLETRSRADAIGIAWDPQPNVAGYNVYLLSDCGTLSIYDANLSTNYSLEGLNENCRYLIFITAYDSFNTEGDPSTVLQYPHYGACFVATTLDGTALSAARTEGRFFVTATPECSGALVSDSPWLTLNSTPAGGRLLISFAAHSNRESAARSAEVKFGSESFTVSQEPGAPSAPILLRPLASARSAAQGSTVQLTTQPEPENNLLFQWFKDGVNISGATNATVTLNDINDSDSGYYSVSVSNDIGSTQDGPVRLTVYTPPVIRYQPSSILASLGNYAIFTVTAQGDELHYQWLKDGLPVGHNSSQITVGPIRDSDLGAYQVVVSNPAASVLSDSANLTTPSHEQALGRFHVALRIDGSLLVQGQGVPGASYDLEVSTDLVNWRKIDSVVVDTGGLFTVDAPNPSRDSGDFWFVRTARRSDAP